MEKRKEVAGIMIKEILKKIGRLYKNFVYSNRFIKLSKAFHYEKFFCKELVLKETDKCLLLAPHPDDETFGCGGLLLKYPQNFEVICLTDGKAGGYNAESPEELAQIRKNEFKSVMDKLNISSYKFMDIPDGKLVYNYDVFKKIKLENYDYIFIPNYFDQHKDHKAVSNLVQKYFINHKAKQNLKIVFYEVWAALPFPNYYTDITTIIKQKKELINLYASQNRYVSFQDGIISLNNYRGMLVNVGYAEVVSIIDLNTYMKL